MLFRSRCGRDSLLHFYKRVYRHTGIGTFDGSGHAAFFLDVYKRQGYICPVWFWENDPFIASDNEPSDSNHGITLKEAKLNFSTFGACEKEMVCYVRLPRDCLLYTSHISMDTLARICETLNCEITDVIELVPVSYTHLDVYKRQVAG